MENILPQIEKIITLTKQGKIKWNAPSPSALRWTKAFEARSVTFTIQSAITVAAGRQEKRYVLSISAPPDLSLQINTQLQKEYLELLETLYSVALESSKSASSEFLDRLLGTI